MTNYFNSLPLRTQLQELGKCRFMDPAEFEAGGTPLAAKNWSSAVALRVLTRGSTSRQRPERRLCLRKEAIGGLLVKATAGFQVGTYEEMVPDADMVLNLTPDKQHTMLLSR